jgi:hypothetical protein
MVTSNWEYLKKPHNAFCSKYNDIVCVIENADLDDIETANGGFHAVGMGTYKGWSRAMWGDGSQKDSFRAIAAGNSYIPLQGFCTYYEVKDLPNDCTKYLYIINIHAVDFFETNYGNGFSKISSRVLEDVRNNKAKIILVVATEGTSNTLQAKDDFEILKHWVVNANLPPENVYYINGNLLCCTSAMKESVPYNIDGVTTFETWNNPFVYENVIEFSPKDDKFLYLNLNRIPRVHRIYLLAELLKADLFDKGLNSYNLRSNPSYKVEQYFNYVIGAYDPKLITYAQRLFKNESEVVDVDTTNNLAGNINLDICARTFVYLTTETLVDPGTLFISEKLWKPIIVGQPFILLGGNGVLQYIKSLGFKTYSEWFDESYDTATSLKEKINIIINNLNKYKDKTVEELKTIREQMKPICQYNQDLFKKIAKEKYYDEKGYHVIGFSNMATKPVLDRIYDIYNNW